MARIVSVVARPLHRLYVEFSDGVAGEINLSARLFGPMFAPLQEDAFFAKVALDEFGAPCWPNGADLAPDGIYRLIRVQAEQGGAG
jgi:hypothetical protein